MITYTVGSRRFNYRIAGVFVADGHLLVHRADGDPFWALPGGRAELGEDAATTLVREMREEIGEDVRVERPLWVVEAFFAYAGQDYHELAMYWLASFSDGGPHPRRAVTFVGHEPGVTLTFRWVPIAELPAIDVRPAFLRTRAGALPAGVEHVVVRV
jgi:8-oxo-dGTP pyrophosphatase MutT (NUDIX family)